MVRPKRLNRYIVWIAGVLLSCNSQAQVEKYNTIDDKQANVLGIELGSSKGELIKLFGKYDSVEFYFDPVVDEDSTERYYYKRSFFDVYQDQITGFTIVDNNYPLTYKNIRVGDSSNALKEIFANSFNQLSAEEKEDAEQLLVVRIADLENNIGYDEEIHLLLDRYILKEISFWTPL